MVRHLRMPGFTCLSLLKSKDHSRQTRISGPRTGEDSRRFQVQAQNPHRLQWPVELASVI